MARSILDKLYSDAESYYEEMRKGLNPAKRRQLAKSVGEHILRESKRGVTMIDVKGIAGLSSGGGVGSGSGLGGGARSSGDSGVR